MSNCEAVSAMTVRGAVVQQRPDAPNTFRLYGQWRSEKFRMPQRPDAPKGFSRSKSLTNKESSQRTDSPKHLSLNAPATFLNPIVVGGVINKLTSVSSEQ